MLNCYYGDVVAVIIPVLDDRALPRITKHYQALVIVVAWSRLSSVRPFCQRGQSDNQVATAAPVASPTLITTLLW